MVWTSPPAAWKNQRASSSRRLREASNRGFLDLEDPTPGQQAILDELGAMLDDYRPAHLDRQASSIQTSGHGWTLEKAIAVELVHASEPDATIELAVGSGEVLVSWLTTRRRPGGFLVPAADVKASRDRRHDLGGTTDALH